MQVFWSWQSDYAPKLCRHFIREALVEAIAAAGSELGLDERVEIDHDTKGTPGMAEIAATILQKISRSAVFVADVTPIGKTDSGKALPNPNVMIELGWAMSKLGSDRMIVVLNVASGWKPDDLPFDIRHRRVLTYSLSDDADSKTRQAVHKKLAAALADALVKNLGAHLDTKAASVSIEGVAANAANRSIWASAGVKLEHNDSMGPSHKTSVHLLDGPRGYIRIIPAAWSNGVPSVSEIGKLQKLWPASSGGSGNYGACDEGYVRYLISGQAADGRYETRDVSMFFDETGELWFLHGTAIGESRRGPTLREVSLLRGWQSSMKDALEMFDQFGASPARKVEAGLFGVRGVRWFGDSNSESPPSRKDACMHTSQERDWSEVAQTAFLAAAFNKVLDLYGIAHVSPEDIPRIVGE